MKKQDKTIQLDQTGTETLVALLSSKTKTEAMEKLSIARQTLYNRIEKYHIDKIMADIPRKALQTLQMGSDMAAETLIKALDSKPERLEAAKEILNRVGVIGNKETTGIAIRDGNKELKIIVTRGE